MATPRVLGQELRLTANLCLALDASVEHRQYYPRTLFDQLTQHRLVCTATTCNNTDHATGGAEDNLLRAGGKLDSGLALVGVVTDDRNVVARSSAQRTSIANLLFDIGDDGTFGNDANGKDVANSQVRVLAGVDELTSVHALIGNECLCPILEFVWASEDDFCEGCATAGIVNDLLDYASDVAMSLGEVELSEFAVGWVKCRFESIFWSALTQEPC
jgi:hypothetical protein